MRKLTLWEWVWILQSIGWWIMFMVGGFKEIGQCGTSIACLAMAHIAKMEAAEPEKP